MILLLLLLLTLLMIIIIMIVIVIIIMMIMIKDTISKMQLYTVMISYDHGSSKIPMLIIKIDDD